MLKFQKTSSKNTTTFCQCYLDQDPVCRFELALVNKLKEFINILQKKTINL